MSLPVKFRGLLALSRTQGKLLVHRVTPWQCVLLHTPRPVHRDTYLMPIQGAASMTPKRHFHTTPRNEFWSMNQGGKPKSNLQIIVVNVSIGVFLAYFLWLREPNDIDAYMERPIWERLPGIDPEQAEAMMKVDKSMGLQVDYKALEEYKKEYYGRKLREIQAEQRQQKIRDASRSHMDMLQQRAVKED